MNTLIQNILVFFALGLALLFLVRKFIWKPKSKSSSACGTDDCGCH
nr:FeoB-associated Cys-rich membrane protein [Winogradskyella sp.]